MISIAIDGPAGAGKSSVSKAVAKEMGFVYVDTGALYRTVALSLINNGISPSDTEGVKAHLGSVKVDMAYENGEQRVMLNGRDVTDEIRTPEVSMAASTSSAIPEVRAFLLGLQREIAENHDIVMDGRDIATVVLPNATVKIFLTAAAEDRATRRYKELILKDPNTKYEDVLRDVIKRDKNDSERAVAPLKPAEDSVIVDTTGNTLEESVEIIKNIIEKAIGR